jgi:hypothetical protein
VTQDVDSMNGTSFSVGLWVYRRRMGVHEYLLSQGVNQPMKRVTLMVNNDNLKLSFYNDDIVTSTYGSDIHTWVHLGFTFDKETLAMKIYKAGLAQVLDNGNLYKTASGTTSASGPIHLGVHKWNTAHYPFNGKLDELRVFGDHALSQPEVSSLMTNPTTDDLGLVLSMTFDGSGGDLGKDSSCRGVGDATSVTAVSVTGKECGSVDSSALISCNR